MGKISFGIILNGVMIMYFKVLTTTTIPPYRALSRLSEITKLGKITINESYWTIPNIGSTIILHTNLTLECLIKSSLIDRLPTYVRDG